MLRAERGGNCVVKYSKVQGARIRHLTRKEIASWRSGMKTAGSEPCTPKVQAEIREAIEVAHLARPENASEAFSLGEATGRKLALIEISNHVARYAREKT